jgi:prepilin-type N-terminal cleavage/methylation domain-containing protein
MNELTNKRTNGLTLIELLIAISIATILTGVVVLMLKTSFDAYTFGQQEVLLEKALDDCLDEIAGEGFENYGLKDSLEILNVTPASITFVPLWVDDSHTLKLEHEHPELVLKTPFTLNRPFKPGAALPIAELSAISYQLSAESRRLKTENWKAVPITFVIGSHKEPLKADDQISLNAPVEPGSKIRFIFHPDAANFPDCAMTISATGGSAFGGKWQQDKIIRTYKGKTDTIPKYNLPGVTLTDFKLQYFDNTNTEVEPRPELIPNITAVKVSLKALTGKQANRQTSKHKNGFTFINIRNTRTAGAGLIIRQGTRIKIPDSKHIRVFSLASVIGIKEGGTIELEARPEKGTIWKIRIELGFDDKIPILKKYSVEYPSGRTVYSETINLTTDLPLNFMNLGGNGRYDYDFDKDGNNVVNLEGDVELVVTKMDADGAALFIRP